jgi:hypothetical protein
MEEEDWIRWIHDMEAPRVHDPREIRLQCPHSTVKYLAIYVREKFFCLMM